MCNEENVKQKDISEDNKLNNDREKYLLDLSMHYDNLLWTVSTLWVGAIGGLILYAKGNYDPYVALFGLALTLCSMFFAFSFRRLRRKVNDLLVVDLKLIVTNTSNPCFTQWDAYACVLLCVTFLWGHIFHVNLVDNCRVFAWVIIFLVALAIIIMWARERFCSK